MATETQQQLADFHQFAVARLSQTNSEIELDSLLLQWYDSKDSDRINVIIKQGLADIDAGLGKPADVVSRELRSRFGLPAQ